MLHRRSAVSIYRTSAVEYLLDADASMSGEFEPVHAVDDYYDGPRTGIAEYLGVRHRFRSVVWPAGETWDSEDDRFELLPEIGDGPAVIARGLFRVRQPVPELPQGVLRPLEVQWTIEDT